MKVALFLCLIAFMACGKNIVDILKCIYKAPKVQELIGDVIAAIVNQDFSKLLPMLKEALPELIMTIINCIIDTNAIEEQPQLGVNDKYTICDLYCKKFPPEEYSTCMTKCMGH